MRKFKHKETGLVAHEFTEYYSLRNTNTAYSCIPKMLVENGKDWEEIIHDYYVSVIKTKNNYFQVFDALMQSTYDTREEWVEYFKAAGGIITSVVRNSDLEQFSIGDKIRGKGLLTYVITDFILYNNSVIIRANATWKTTTSIRTPLCDAIKYEKPSFITDDVVEVYENQPYWFINIEGCEPFWTPKMHTMGIKDRGLSPLGSKQFSTLEAAEDYILQNKPCLSLNDLERNIDFKSEINADKWFKQSKTWKNWENLVKERI